jgi:SAM-dependent methyltransferase
MKSYLNLGCGTRFHPAWTNVDVVASDPSVLSHDLVKGIPFPDQSFDVVYHSHLLEHFPKSKAPSFLRECHRVLNPQGTIRIAVPDLERIVRVYLEALEKASRGDEQWCHHYEWMVLELLDQTVRDRPGGEMSAYLLAPDIRNREFVLKRIGSEAQNVFDRPQRDWNDDPTRSGTRPELRQLLSRGLAFMRERMLRVFIGKEYGLLQLARFRRGGEIHLWMYDRYSLSELLVSAGFRNPKIVSALESKIPGWPDYHLDTEPDGTILKPDSIFIEATK